MQYHYDEIEPIPFRTIHMDHLIKPVSKKLKSKGTSPGYRRFVHKTYNVISYLKYNNEVRNRSIK